MLTNLFTLFCRRFKFVLIYAVFLPNLYSQNFRVHKEMVISKSGWTLFKNWQIILKKIILSKQWVGGQLVADSGQAWVHKRLIEHCPLYGGDWVMFTILVVISS